MYFKVIRDVSSLPSALVSFDAMIFLSPFHFSLSLCSKIVEHEWQLMRERVKWNGRFMEQFMDETKCDSLPIILLPRISKDFGCGKLINFWRRSLQVICGVNVQLNLMFVGYQGLTWTKFEGAYKIYQNNHKISNNYSRKRKHVWEISIIRSIDFIFNYNSKLDVIDTILSFWGIFLLDFMDDLFFYFTSNQPRIHKWDWFLFFLFFEQYIEIKHSILKLFLSFWTIARIIFL